MVKLCTCHKLYKLVRYVLLSGLIVGLMIVATFIVHSHTFKDKRNNSQPALYDDKLVTRIYKEDHNAYLGNFLKRGNIYRTSNNSEHNKNKVSSTSVAKTTHNTLRRWNTSHPIVFLHIGKAGGTSFDIDISRVVRSLGGTYKGNRHFDWSAIEAMENPDVVVMLRYPVSRAVSDFYFTRRKHILPVKGTISEYIRNPQNLLETRAVWHDGKAGAMWLTGTHIGPRLGIKPHQIEAREIQFLDYKRICRDAVSRLKQTLWFGFLSEQRRSFEMLQWQLGYSKPIHLRKTNVTPHPNITVEDEAILQSLMPIDLWLYDYAKRLFEARWTQYKSGIYREPELRSFPEVNCMSTRYILACNKKSPLGPLYHVWNVTTKNTLKHMKLLPKSDWV